MISSIVLVTVSSCDQVPMLLGKEKEVGMNPSSVWNIRENGGTRKPFCTFIKVWAGSRYLDGGPVGDWREGVELHKALPTHIQCKVQAILIIWTQILLLKCLEN